MRSFAAASLLAATLASATIYVTEPVASTSCASGTPCTVTWNDDGNAPVLATIGACSIDLCTGGQQQQTCLENISPSTDVSQTASVSYLPNANIGPDGNEYFIKFTSLAFKDPTDPQFPFTAFSAKFTLTGMTGTFNSTIEQEISGAASVAAVTTPASVATPSAAPASSVVTVTKAATTAAATSKTTTTTTKKSGAVSATVPGVVSSVAGVAIMFSFGSVFLGMLAFGL